MSRNDAVYNAQEALDRLGGDRELMATIATLLLEDLPSNLVALDQELAAGDAHAAGKTAHTIKGAVSNFCADEATALAKDLELAGKEGRLDRARELAPPLRASLKTLMAALQQDWC